jgi:hypothetical protein
LSTHRVGQVVGVYFEQSRRPFASADIGTPRTSIGSPLCDRVVDEHGDSAYAAAAVHLFDIARGGGRRVSGLSQRKAWREVVQRYPNALASCAQAEITP